MSVTLCHKTTVAGFFTEPLEPDTGKPGENSQKTHLVVPLFLGGWVSAIHNGLMHVLDTRQLRTGKSEDRGPVSFVFVFCVTFLLQDEPKLPPDEKELDARALGGPVLGRDRRGHARARW